MMEFVRLVLFRRQLRLGHEVNAVQPPNPPETFRLFPSNAACNVETSGHRGIELMSQLNQEPMVGNFPQVHLTRINNFAA